jgi:hypothetical protein
MPTALELAQGRTAAMEGLFAAARVLREAQVPANSPRSIELFRELIALPDQEAMRRHIREAAGTSTASKYTPSVRRHLATTGEARPDGSYPIRSAADVSDAVADFDRSEGSEADREHIIARAKAVPDGTNALPASWAGSTRSLQESATPGWAIPTLDGGTLGPTRLREAKTAADLGSLGVPILADSPLVGQRQSGLPAGIPVLAAAPGATLRPAKLTESISGTVLSRIS